MLLILTIYIILLLFKVLMLFVLMYDKNKF